jgi:hypothetical protein
MRSAMTFSLFFALTPLAFSQAPGGRGDMPMNLQHPCVLVPQDGIGALRAKAANEVPNRFGFATAAAWKDIQTKADRFLDAPPYSYSVNIPLAGNKYAGVWEYTLSDETPPRHDDTPAYPPWTAMFQERADSITTRLMHLSFAYLVTGRKPYAERAAKIAGHLAKWDYWTDPSYGRGTLRACLDTGHCTYAMGMFYDWCYDAITETQRKEIRDAIVRNGIQACLEGVDRYPPDTNGYAVILSGAVIASVAVLPETPQATEWLQQAIGKIRVSLDRGGKDGGAFEGPMYGTYLLDSFAKALDALEAARFPHTLFEHPYLATMERYCIGLLAPDTNRIPCFGDGGPTAGFPQLMSILAHRGSSAAAWYLQQIDALEISTIYDFIRFNADALTPRQPDWNPSSVFVDIGYASLRDGFNSNAPSLFFKAGPYDNLIGHNHFDHNSFVVSYGGEWILPDRGYHSRYDPHERKFSLGSLGHSTVVLDVGKEYLDATEVPDPGHDQVSRTGAHITEYVAGQAYDLVTGAAAEAYNPENNTVLERFDRTILYLKPHFFVIHDRLSAPDPRSFCLLLQADGMSDLQADGATFLVRRIRGEVGGTVAATSPVTLTAGPYPNAEKYGPFLRIESRPTTQMASTILLHPRPNINPEFIRNGSFERDMAGWRPRANEDRPNHEIVTDNPADGAHCARITNSGYYYSDMFTVEPGKTVTAKARIRTTDLPEDKGAVMRLYFWRGGKAFANKSLSGIAHRDWQEHTISAVVPEDTEEVCLALEFFAPGTGWFDDVRVEAEVHTEPVEMPTITEVAAFGLDASIANTRFLVAFKPERGAEPATQSLVTDADVAAVALDAGGKVRSLFVKNGTTVSFDGNDLLRAEQPLTGELRFDGNALVGHFPLSAEPHASPATRITFLTALPVDAGRINGKSARISTQKELRRIDIR